MFLFWKEQFFPFVIFSLVSLPKVKKYLYGWNIKELMLATAYFIVACVFEHIFGVSFNQS